MTLAHINIQAFPRDKRKHFLLYFQRLSSCLGSSIPFICFHCWHWMCRGKTSMGGSLRLEMLCVTTLPSPYLFLTSPNISSEMKRTKCWQKIKFAEWQEILARLHSSRFHRPVSEEAQPKLNRCIQMIIYSLLRWKDLLALAEEPQRHLSVLWSFTVAFELYLACVINGRIHTHKAMLLFWRDGRGGGGHWLAERERSGSALLPHEEDAVKRIRCKDFTIFLVQMGSLKLQFTHICGSRHYLVIG